MRTLSVMLLFLGFSTGTLACQPNEECKNWSGASGTSTWTECGDKQERKVECETVATEVATPVTCRCSVAGVAGKSFHMADPSHLAAKDNAIRMANEQCDWHLR
jgi:hypothetical protein